MSHYLIPAADLQAVRKALEFACRASLFKEQALAAINAAQRVGEAAWVLTNGEVTKNVTIKQVHDCRNHDKAIPLYGASNDATKTS